MTDRTTSKEWDRFTAVIHDEVYRMARRTKIPPDLLGVPFNRRYPGMNRPVPIKPSLRRRGWQR